MKYGIEDFKKCIVIKQNMNKEQIEENIANDEEKIANDDKKQVIEEEIPNSEEKRVDYEYMKEREIKLMRNLYSIVNRYLLPFVKEVLDEYDYLGSPIYSVMGIDRETLAQMVDMVIAKAEEGLDEVQEVKLDSRINTSETWDKWLLLRATVEGLLLTEIFMVRRPEYFEKFILREK